MYAVLKTGGKQYRVQPGSTLTVEKVAGQPGSSVTFDRILLIGDGESVTVGTPTVPGASVSATVLGEALGPKLVVFKFKQKVKYRRRTGHRQHLTRVRIDAISADGRTERAEPRDVRGRETRGDAKSVAAVRIGKPAAAKRRPAEASPRPAEASARPAEASARPTKASARPTKASAKPAEAGAEAAPPRARHSPARSELAPSPDTAEQPQPKPARAKRPRPAQSAADALSSASQVKPRTRRTTKPKAEQAKEE